MADGATPLLVVDVQQGFLNEFTRHIPARIARPIGRGRFAPVLFTRFINAPGSPYRAFLGWDARGTEPETTIAPELTFAKPGYAGIPETLGALPREGGIEQLTIRGIDTDMCVLKVAMDVFDLGIRPIVLTDCCASTAGMQAHLAGLAVLARNIGAEQLRDLGMNEGMLGAPNVVAADE
ncbi:MAG: isochorismatase family cysteine hydrolase [Thermomicrobiales bacterium]